MRIFLFFLIAIILSQDVLGQFVLEPQWTKQIGSVGSGSAEAWGIDVDPEGNVFWPINVDSIGDHDVYCFKYDIEGNPLWNIPFHYEATTDEFSHICDASSEHIYIGGSTCLLPGVSCDMHLIKVDKETGTLVWEHSTDFGNMGYDEIDGLEVREDGIYLSGWAQDIQTGLWQIDMGLAKINIDGTPDWSISHGQAQTGEHLDGHFVVEEDRIVATGLWEGTSVTNIFNGRSFIGTFSKSDGSLLDSTLFNNETNPFIFVENPLGMATDGVNYYVTGYVTPETLDNYEIFFAKFDQDLNQVFYHTWGGSITESARGICVHEGLVYIAGLTTSPEIAVAGEGDALLLVYDTAGTFLSSYIWGNEQLDSFRDVVVHDGSIYLSGISGTGFSSGESEFANLIKVDISTLVDVEESQISEAEVIVYPNPTSGRFRVQVLNYNSRKFTFKLFDILGSEYISQVMNETNKEFDLILAPGVYYYLLSTEQNFRKSGRLLIK